MKAKLIRIGLIAVCTVFTVFTATFAEAMTEKNETVYAILDHDGSVMDLRVVNHLRIAGESREVVDYGQYSTIKNMESEWAPIVNNGKIIWEPGATEGKDIYYEGETDKELPIEIKIRYFLNGTETHGMEFAGKDGTLRVEISLSNKTGTVIPVTFDSLEHGTVTKQETLYVPFLVQVSYEASLERFSKINAPDAIRVVTGKTMNLGFSAFPYPDADISFELTGTDIELNPITFTVVPCMPPMPDLEITGELENLFKGFEAMSSALSQLQQVESELIGLATGQVGEIGSTGTEGLAGGIGATGMEGRAGGAGATGTENLAEGIELTGVEELAGGIAPMGREGLTGGIGPMGMEELAQMRKALAMAVDNMRFTEQMKKKMEELAGDYRSFTDNMRNRNSSVQFIIKTEKVVPDEIDEYPAAPPQKVKRNIWQRLLDLFRF